MYNEHYKTSFIEHCLKVRFDESKLSASMVYAIFRKTTAPFEVLYGKDVAFFSEEEILQMLAAKESRSLDSLLNTVTLLRQYADFVISTFSPGIINAFGNITKDKVSSCISAKATSALLTREEICNIQSQMLNEVDKAILECLFMGISGKNLEDLTYLSIEQLDIESQTLTLKSGKTVRLSEEQCTMLIAAFNESISISYGQSGQESPVSGVGRIYKEKLNSRPGDTPDKRFRWVLRRVVIWREHFNMDVLTMKSIAMSGLVHHLRTSLERTGLSLREFLRSSEGKQLALQYGYDSEAHYVEVIVNKVKKYL